MTFQNYTTLDGSFLVKIWPKLVLGPTLPEPSMLNRHAGSETPFATDTHGTVND